MIRLVQPRDLAPLILDQVDRLCVPLGLEHHLLREMSLDLPNLLVHDLEDGLLLVEDIFLESSRAVLKVHDFGR